MKCKKQSDCPENLACSGGVCVDKCATVRCASPNQCFIINNRAQCLKVCKTNDDCDDNLSCNGGACQDPCLKKKCGKKYVCKGVGHKAVCFKKCKSNTDCPKHLNCEDGLCQDPCLYYNCGINYEYKCHVIDYIIKCINSCLYDKDCLPGRVCSKKTCKNP